MKTSELKSHYPIMNKPPVLTEIKNFNCDGIVTGCTKARKCPFAVIQTVNASMQFTTVDATTLQCFARPTNVFDNHAL